LNDAYQAMGSTIKSVQIGCPNLNNAAQAFTLSTGNSRMYIASVYLPKAVTLTGVKFIQGTTGVYTANNYNGFGLYTVSSGTLTLVASSTNDANVFKSTANTMIAKPFSSTYSAAAGIYYVALLCSSSASTTSPSVAAATSLVNIGAATSDFTNNNRIFASIDTQTSLPSTLLLSSTTVGSQSISMFLY
jgi:hypothetical protein